VLNFDWMKIKQASISHPWIGLLLLAWMLSVPLYIIFQAWFGYAWAGRWRAAALIPLAGLAALVLLFFIGETYAPDVWGPLPEDAFDNPIVAVMLFAPVGFIYLAIAGIAHRTRSRPTTS
jgi:hypothetical protein